MTYFYLYAFYEIQTPKNVKFAPPGAETLFVAKSSRHVPCVQVLFVASGTATWPGRWCLSLFARFHAANRCRGSRRRSGTARLWPRDATRAVRTCATLAGSSAQRHAIPADCGKGQNRASNARTAHAACDAGGAERLNTTRTAARYYPFALSGRVCTVRKVESDQLKFSRFFKVLILTKRAPYKFSIKN